MRWLHGFLEEMDEETVRHYHCWRAKEMAACMSLSSVRDGGCFYSMHSRSPDGFPGPTTSQVSAGGRVFYCLGHGFPTSGGSIHGPSADGIGTASLCRAG